MSLCEGDDRRVVLNCFAGCSFPEIAAAAGLSVFDFFPPRTGELTPQEKRAISRRRREADWAAALRVLAHECVVLLVIAAHMRDRPLDDSGSERLRLAVSRVQGAKEVLA